MVTPVSPVLTPMSIVWRESAVPSVAPMAHFEVVVSMRVLLYDNGTGNAEDGTTEYGDDAPTTCYACQCAGKFADFDE